MVGREGLKLALWNSTHTKCCQGYLRGVLETIQPKFLSFAEKISRQVLILSYLPFPTSAIPGLVIMRVSQTLLTLI